MKRFASTLLLLFPTPLLAAPAAGPARPPNIIIVFADDLGYADVGVFGATGFKTPNVDRLAREGRRFTDFYVSQPVCSASRTSLLTGCYANRLGIHGALNPATRHGIDAGETTIAEVLKTRGYATAICGKWHLGHHPQFLPPRHGFDEYFGLPYSNDMWPRHPTSGSKFPPLPLIDGERVVEEMPDQSLLTRRYTDRALKFIEKNRERPFFLYLAHSMPHVPIFASAAHRGKSARGLYGDVIEEIDASVGEILAALEKQGIDRETLVIFTSDNGPWLSYGDHGGSAGPLREGKGTCWEGGVRVPCLMRWPGRIPAGTTSSEPVMTIDLLPTLARLVGADLPARTIDGKDIWPVIAGEPDARSPHEALFFYYEEGALHAMRSGQWKLQLPHRYRTLAGRPGGTGGKPADYSQAEVGLELYDLETDIGETKDVAKDHPEVVERLLKLVEACREELGDSLTGRKGKGVREPGRLP